MTEQHQETHVEQAGAVGLEGLSESEAVLGVRFFVAARAESPEAARNLLTQEIKPTDKKVRIEGIYNPVLEGISIAERKDYWEKEGSPYEVALQKWSDRFTYLISKVTDQTRIAAFKSILPQNDDLLKAKELKDIDKDDALKLFNEYSNNKSDIDKFMGRAITNLTSAGVLEPEALQAHINHLRWIATGFFGKETASMIGTQILLEVERQIDRSVAGRSVVNDFIDENLERVNNFGPEEAEILRVVSQQAAQPVSPTPAAQPAQPVVQVPAYDENELLPSPSEDLSGLTDDQLTEKISQLRQQLRQQYRNFDKASERENLDDRIKERAASLQKSGRIQYELAAVRREIDARAEKLKDQRRV